MPARSRRKAQKEEVNPSIKLAVPKSFNMRKTIEMSVASNQFQCTWIDLFRQRCPTLFTQVCNKADQFVIRDIRVPVDRKEWKLTNLVIDFIDSFQRTRQCYQATLVVAATSRTRQSASNMNTPRNVQSNAKSATGAGNKPQPRNVITANFIPIPSTPSSSRRPPITIKSPNVKSNTASPLPGPGRKRKGANAEPQPQTKKPTTGPVPTENEDEEVNLNFTGRLASRLNGFPQGLIPPNHLRYAEDACSMAASQDSQDSQDDLIDAGVRIEPIKGKILLRMTEKVSNSDMLRIQLELNTLKANDKWSKLLARAPFTAGILQMVFEI